MRSRCFFFFCEQVFVCAQQFNIIYKNMFPTSCQVKTAFANYWATLVHTNAYVKKKQLELCLRYLQRAAGCRQISSKTQSAWNLARRVQHIDEGLDFHKVSRKETLCWRANGYETIARKVTRKYCFFTCIRRVVQ